MNKRQRKKHKAKLLWIRIWKAVGRKKMGGDLLSTPIPTYPPSSPPKLK